MPKGHSDIPQRMAALEGRLDQVEKLLAEMQESFNRGSMPRPREYQSMFTVWPSANPNTNGS